MLFHGYKIWLLLLFFPFQGCVRDVDIEKADIVIYGGTSAGIVAAVQAVRMGKSVVVIHPDKHIGGLTTGGLGQTDIGNKMVIGGISREFYQRVKAYYSDTANWVWQKHREYRDSGQTRTSEGEDAMWTFEPKAAQAILSDFIREYKINIILDERLDREKGVIKKNNRIYSIRTESGKEFRGKMFIDATYEGDLMAATGVSYTVGRESNNQYGESLNGIQPSELSFTFSGDSSRNAINHNFVHGVDPYTVKGDASSGLLPCISPGGAGEEGIGDDGVQAYCFRMCLTDHPDNRNPFEKPVDYDDLDYELLFRNFEAGETAIPWINSSMPNRKTDTNNGRGFSMDFIGQNYNYPEGSYTEREKIVEAHLNYQKGFMWSLAYHPRVPWHIRDEVSRWGACKDEFEQNSGWPTQIYVREARRMIGSCVMTQKHCEQFEVAEDPVGMAAYGMDSHNVKRYVTNEGYVKNEGNVEAHVKSPFPISYRSIVPKKEECANLLVPVCLSATHIAFGSIRMEPVFMVLGQSAATAACLCIDKDIPVQELDYNLLREELLRGRQIIGMPGKVVE